MAIVINKAPAEGYKYTPISQKEEKSPFSVWVKPISSKDLMGLEDGVVKRQDETVYLAAGLFSFKVMQKALVAWEGITDASGEDIKLKRNSDGTVSEETISYIPSELITEIANVVSSISRNPANIQIFFDTEEADKEVKVKK